MSLFGTHPITTPNYAWQYNEGGRERDFVETMARMFIQVGPAEYPRFLASIRAVGDPDSVRLAEALVGTGDAEGADKGGLGYIDFLLQSAQHGFQEKRDLVELMGDNYVVYYLGSNAPVFSYGGILVNSREDDQAHAMYRIYRDMIRGTQLARRRKLLTLRYDNMLVRGTVDSFGWQLGAENEMVCPFSFQLTVKTITMLPNPRAVANLIASDTSGMDSPFHEQETYRLENTTGLAVDSALTREDPRAGKRLQLSGEAVDFMENKDETATVVVSDRPARDPAED